MDDQTNKAPWDNPELSLAASQSMFEEGTRDVESHPEFVNSPYASEVAKKMQYGAEKTGGMDVIAKNFIGNVDPISLQARQSLLAGTLMQAYGANSVNAQNAAKIYGQMLEQGNHGLNPTLDPKKQEEFENLIGIKGSYDTLFGKDENGELKNPMLVNLMSGDHSLAWQLANHVKPMAQFEAEVRQANDNWGMQLSRESASGFNDLFKAVNALPEIASALSGKDILGAVERQRALNEFGEYAQPVTSSPLGMGVRILPTLAAGYLAGGIVGGVAGKAAVAEEESAIEAGLSKQGAQKIAQEVEGKAKAGAITEAFAQQSAGESASRSIEQHKEFAGTLVDILTNYAASKLIYGGITGGVAGKLAGEGAEATLMDSTRSWIADTGRAAFGDMPFLNYINQASNWITQNKPDADGLTPGEWLKNSYSDVETNIKNFGILNLCSEISGYAQGRAHLEAIRNVRAQWAQPSMDTYW